MENAEEILHYLEVFTKRKSKSIPPELNDYLSFVARTGDTVFQWGLVKSLFKEKLLAVLADFYETSPGIDIPPYPNVDPFNYDAMKNSLLEKLDSFLAAPFTLQRISELLINPRKQYNRIDKFMRAIEKNILVVSTREPGPHLEHDNGDHGDSIHNGSDNNSDYNVDVEMEEVSWKASGDRHYRARPSSSDHQKHDDDDIEIEEDNRKSARSVEPHDEYESVTPPDESANDGLSPDKNDESDMQDSECMDDDKVDESSSSSDEILPKPKPKFMNTTFDNITKTTTIPEIVIHVEMAETKDTSPLKSDEETDASNINETLHKKESTQFQHGNKAESEVPIDTEASSPPNNVDNTSPNNPATPDNTGDSFPAKAEDLSPQNEAEVHSSPNESEDSPPQNDTDETSPSNESEVSPPQIAASDDSPSSPGGNESNDINMEQDLSVDLKDDRKISETKQNTSVIQKVEKFIVDHIAMASEKKQETKENFIENVIKENGTVSTEDKIFKKEDEDISNVENQNMSPKSPHTPDILEDDSNTNSYSNDSSTEVYPKDDEPLDGSDDKENNALQKGDALENDNSQGNDIPQENDTPQESDTTQENDTPRENHINQDNSASQGTDAPHENNMNVE